MGDWRGCPTHIRRVGIKADIAQPTSSGVPVVHRIPHPIAHGKLREFYVGRVCQGRIGFGAAVAGNLSVRRR